MRFDLFFKMLSKTKSISICNKNMFPVFTDDRQNSTGAPRGSPEGSPWHPAGLGSARDQGDPEIPGEVVKELRSSSGAKGTPEEKGPVKSAHRFISAGFGLPAAYPRSAR